MESSSTISENYNSTTTESYGTYLEHQLISALGCTACSVGLLGNLAVIFAILTVKKLQTKTNVLVLNLAVADILTCLIAPLQVAAALNDEPVLPPWLCKLGAFCLQACTGCSINTLALIAVNRLIGVTFRAVYLKLYTRSKLFLMIFVSWGVPVAVATIPLFTNYAEYGFNPDFKTCTWTSNDSDVITYALLVSVLYFPLQFTILFVSYLKIYLYVRRTTKAILRHDNHRDANRIGPQTLQRHLWKRQVTVTKNLFIVVCVFFLCICPFFITLGLPTNVSKNLMSWASVIFISNSAVNPIIYGTKHPDFRAAFAHILRCRRKKHKPEAVRTISVRILQQTE